jgi:carbonic anhydrase
VEAGSGVRRSPPDTLAALLAGNRRFVENDPRSGPPRPRSDQPGPPLAAVVACMDGRVPVEAAFDQDTGDIVAIRSGGHVLDRAVLGSIEFAVTQLRVGAVLVLGHTGCAAVEAAVAAERTGEGPGGATGYLIEQIAPAVRDAGAEPSVIEVVRAHVRRTVARLRTSTHLPHGDPAALVGAVYELHTGLVEVLD